MSRCIDLQAEMDLASDALTPRRLMDAGLDWEAAMTAGGIGLLRAEIHADSAFQPVPEGGQPLWCLPCFYGPIQPSTLADIVAWSPATPDCWYRRTGLAAVLGYVNVQRCRASVWDFGGDEPLPPPTLTLHPTPKHYALAGFDGAVILDWEFGPPELEGVEQVHCGVHVDLAEKLDHHLQRRQPTLPKILVHDQRKARAA
ncbi:MAG: hypothetical protein ACFCUT_06705 [Kiloniellaceae bacterium]